MPRQSANPELGQRDTPWWWVCGSPHVFL